MESKPFKVADARGELCPRPVMMARELVVSGEPAISVIVDNEVAASNVTRFLEGSGYHVTREESEGHIVINALRDDGALSDMSASSQDEERRAYLLLSEYVGYESEGLGEVLMKSFIGTVAASSPLPSVIALMNGAVKLTLAESTCSITLKEMEEKGVTVLVCGTCVKHFGIMDNVSVGRISNMFEITEAVFGASKPIVMG